MSLNFEIANWQVEVTWEALHLHPKGDAAPPRQQEPRDLQPTVGKKFSVADYFLFTPFVQRQRSADQQES